MDEIKLKPCPFCGAEIRCYEMGFQGPKCVELEVRCDVCHTRFVIESPFLHSNFDVAHLQDVIEIWNSRKHI